MPLSSVLGAQSLVRPGVCTSSTRPASPFEGQVIYETDTDKIMSYNGSAWTFVSVPSSVDPSVSTSYTPTWTNLTTGNGTVDFKYVQINKLVMVRGSFIFGSTSSVSGHIKFSLPVTSVSYTGNPHIGVVNFVDAGTNAPLGTVLWDSTTVANLQAVNAAGTYALRTDTSATIPFTWTTNDRIELQVLYEAA